MTTTAKKVLITNADDAGKTYTVDALLLPDGRLYVAGAGVDGGDSLFASLGDYEPQGTDKRESAEVLDETAPVTLDQLACGDVDNVEYAESLLTADERAAVLLSDDRQCERWRGAAGAWS
jgi:hypothetical protein